MFKRATVLLLIVSVLASNLSYYFIFAGFELNQKYIAENLCVNRNKPWLHCNGRCYFAKKLRQAQEKQNSEESQSQKNLFQVAYHAQPAAVKFHTCLLLVIPVPTDHALLPQIAQPIFRPPQLG